MYAAFASRTDLLGLLDAMESALFARYKLVKAGPRATQVSYYNRYCFMAVSPSRAKSRTYITISLFLPCRLDSQRVLNSSEPYPGRWTHHIRITEKEDIDSELLCWIDEAYNFAMAKK